MDRDIANLLRIVRLMHPSEHTAASHKEQLTHIESICGKAKLIIGKYGVGLCFPDRPEDWHAGRYGAANYYDLHGFIGGSNWYLIPKMSPNPPRCVPLPNPHRFT